jgi:fatty-acyl-CoA synthase
MTGVPAAYWPADRSVDIVDMTVGRLLLDAADDAPDTVALVEGVADPAGRRRWTLAELAGDALGAARELLDRYRPGERLAIWAPSVPEWEIVQFGAALAGLVVVTVNPALTAGELAYILGHSRASGVAYVPSYRDVDLAARLDEVRQKLPDLRDTIDLSAWTPERLDHSRRGALPPVAAGDAAMVQYTSGTTGQPKGAVLSHRGLTNNARLFARRFGIPAGSVWINPLPMFHVGGCEFVAMGALWGRCTHVMTAFEPGLALQLIEQERGAFFPGVPTMLRAMLEHPDFAGRDLSSLRFVMSGGTTIDPELVRLVEASFGASFGAVYGQTEVSGVICQSHPTDTVEQKSETAGRPLEQTEVRIADPDTGETLGCDRVGEICVRGFGVMLGYFEAPDATAEALGDDGWLRTGDLGTMSADGYVQVTGRLKDMIIRGGENIYPREIEDRLQEHPDVADVAVVGVPDERFGEQVAAFVRPAPGAEPSAAALHHFLRDLIAPHKMPRLWFSVDTFPLTPSGKIQKFVLRDGFVDGRYAPLP